MGYTSTANKWVGGRCARTKLAIHGLPKGALGEERKKRVNARGRPQREALENIKGVLPKPRLRTKTSFLVLVRSLTKKQVRDGGGDETFWP